MDITIDIKTQVENTDFWRTIICDQEFYRYGT